MAQKKVCDKEFKIQAVKLGREIGFSKVALIRCMDGINAPKTPGWIWDREPSRRI